MKQSFREYSYIMIYEIDGRDNMGWGFGGMRDIGDWLGGCCYNLVGDEVKYSINGFEVEKVNVTFYKEKRGWELCQFGYGNKGEESLLMLRFNSMRFKYVIYVIIYQFVYVFGLGRV